MSKLNTPIVLSVSDWNTSSIRYMQPKVNDRGAKSVNIISTQSNRALSFQTPLMMTWGISDFVDEKGESDGKYTMSLNFPNDQYRKPSTDDFLAKLKSFENQILDDAVKNCEVWFGESEMSREVLKHMYFQSLKYTKDKVTKKIDLTKPPSIRAKVPNYDGRWSVELYDTNSKMLFPDSSNPNITPIDLVPKQSNVAAVLQCGGLWFGGKGWGLTWKLVQAVVKPKEIVSIFGKCHIQLSADEITAMDKQPVVTDIPEEEELTEAVVPSTTVDDSDDEVAVEEEEEEVNEPVPVPVKKVVKKQEAPVAVQVEEAVKPTVVKKIIKKKV
jgi:hypothetical protein